MIDGLFHIAFIGPGGPEFLMVMLVLLMMFGAKDAPRILRKLNEIISQIRNTADGFKREVMYGDLNNDTPSYDESTESGDEYGDEYDYDNEEFFEDLEETLTPEDSEEEPEEDSEEESETEPEVPGDEDGDAQKT